MEGFEDALFRVFDEEDRGSQRAPIGDATEVKPLKRGAPRPGITESLDPGKGDFKPEVKNKGNVKRENEVCSTTMISVEKKQRVESVLDDLNISELKSRIKVHAVETLEACTHEVAVPPDTEYTPLKQPNSKPAKEYKFILDPFQKEAILCIDNNQSVLVSAHTSAGKTVVAEYSIALSLRDRQRVIYTTPIKALSNQKYREFYEEFRDVGLVTGDVTINPTASCLIMTTEILRNMLYRGSEIMREVGWVVFDEIHYLRDKERGVVWEETLILLPDNVHYVFLSATIPNARQFAEWVCHIHHQPCHVVYTDYRPVPLQHYIFPAGGDGIHLVVDEQGVFKEENFNKAMACVQNAGDAAKGDQKGRRGGPKGDPNIYRVVKMVMEHNFAPVIIFSFSKKDCEVYALQMAKLDFNSVDEKRLVDEVFNNAMEVLNQLDRRLPQVENVLPLLRRGIGIHHGGLLPILKETIEILFAKGLIKALFATETFAMGLNMPARTVLFTGLRKFDGKDFRFLTSGEYIQMSGRAGRRGLDEKGAVILMVDEKVGPAVGREIIKGLPDPIDSAFHLTFKMILNLSRVEEINPEYMVEQSFFQFQNQSSIPVLYNKIQALQEKIEQMVVPKEPQVAACYRIRDHLEELGKQFQYFITRPEILIPFLQPGRLVKIKNDKEEYDWGIVVNFKKKEKGGRNRNPIEDPPTLIVDVLLHVIKNDGCITDRPKPCPPGEQGDAEIVPVMHSSVHQISFLRVHCPKDLRPPDNRRAVLKTVMEVKKRFKDGVPLLNPIQDMHVTDKIFLNVVKRIEQFEERLYAHPLHNTAELDSVYPTYLKKVELERDLRFLKLDLKTAKSLLQMDELKCRKRVLRRLGYCSAADEIEMKGRVACELSSGDELLMTEMIFNNIFNDLTPAQAVALISTFVCDEKSSKMPRLSDDLSGPLRQMQELARRIARISVEAKIDIDEATYVDSFKPYLMDVIYAWCRGATFLEICKMTDIFEGSIIRCMRRLEEILRQLCQAAKNIGNTDLENKFSKGIKLIKRDIVFAASLYLLI